MQELSIPSRVISAVITEVVMTVVMMRGQ